MKMLLVTGAQLRAARALVRMEQEKLAASAGISAATIRNLENSEGPLNARTGTLRALQHALEEAGVVFLGDDDGGPGVRLRTPTAA
jgi:transcriptional regulator with XRE-family HTH domain